MQIRVDADRLRADFDALASFGGTPEGGIRRTTFSAAHLDARAWFLDRARAAGLEASVDSAANHSAILPSRVPGAKTLLLGSHLDSVREAGRYDGALGVLCALEVVRAVQDAKLALPVALEAIDFTDEEGTLVGTLGSWALAGQLTAEHLDAPRGGRDLLVAEFERMGLTERGILAAGRDPTTLVGLLELHIEQGPVLERAGVEIGIVTAISGSSSFHVQFEGEARHAGTTPMDARRDASLGAAAFVLGVRETTTRLFPGCVATVGDIAIEPGSFNVVPRGARLLMECRSPDAAELSTLEAALGDLARREAAAFGLGVTVERVGRWEPTPTDPRFRTALFDAATALGLSAMEVPSGAGHDAQAVAPITPIGMVFVPSVGGVSHDPSEYTSWEDCVNGANVLLGATVRLAQALSS
ncbi:M20 family metallo-hydrolase [Gaiella sp.]|uniref:M20 family metallo-hydrolase n=1 Tax=Gaiella sp. TaxID=2663207 RepID=UPI0032662F9D